MTQGVVMFAENNEEYPYIDFAIYNSIGIQKYLTDNITIITNEKSLKESKIINHKRIAVPPITFITIDESDSQQRIFYNSKEKMSLTYLNSNRTSIYDLTPYDETIVIDADYIINDNLLSNCYNLKTNLMLTNKCMNIFDVEFLDSLHSPLNTYIYELGLPMYWATAFYFRKSAEAKNFFDLVNHVKENYNYYASYYRYPSTVYRNDYTFTIAAHLLNNSSSEKVIESLQHPLYVLSYKDRVIFNKPLKHTHMPLIAIQEHTNKQTPAYYSLHVLNKNSLKNIIEEFAKE